MDVITLYVLFIAFLASTIRSAFGFGESLIAVPLLALFIPVDIAVPLSVLYSITIALFVVIMDWREIHLESAKHLILSSFFGIPLGLFILKYGDEKMIKIFLGLIIIFFSLFSLKKGESFKLQGKKRFITYLCGFFSGVLGGAYGMNGPPLVIYGGLRGWKRENFRATLQAYFLLASSLAMLGYLKVGLWTSTVTHYYWWSMLVLIPSIFLGKKINKLFPEKLFKKTIFVSLIGIGVILILSSFLKEYAQAS